MKRIRLEKIEDIDFTNPEVIRLLARAYALLLKDKESKGKGCR